MPSLPTAPDREHLFQQVTQLALSEAAALLCAGNPVEIGLQLRSCRHGERSGLLAGLPDDGELFCVSQSLRPHDQGMMAWLCPRLTARRLLRQLLAEEIQLEVLTEMDEEVLTEVGNRIINRCLEHHAQLIPRLQGAGPPRLWRDVPEQLDRLLPCPDGGEQASLVEIGIRHGDGEGRCWLLWCGQPWREALS